MICANLEPAYAFAPLLKTCSFDVFDTFLMRRSTGPEGVYEQTCRLLEERTGRRLPVESFVQHRIKAEAKARCKAFADRRIVEVSIEEIHASLPWRLFGLDPADTGPMIQAELDAEILLCRANSDMLALFKAFQTLGIRCGFISDTYWSRQQLGHLLAACAPGVTWDFLFCSSESGTGKVDNLFAHYLASTKVEPTTALHIGDNERADIAAAKRHGLRTHFYPQASSSLAETFPDEDFLFRQICLQPQQSARLDHGFRVSRRRAEKHIRTSSSIAGSIGHRCIAPILALFQAFIEKELAALRSDPGKRVALVFLGRDGFLPYQLWTQCSSDDGYYVEINRRISLIASAANKAPICSLLAKIPAIDARAAKSILKFRHSHIDRFFAKAKKQTVPGSIFAEAMRDFIDDEHVVQLATKTRHELLRYLRTTIPDFDSITDIVLVDLGYSATIQKYLRNALDLAGLGIRLHGRYLLTLDDDLIDIPAIDSAVGLISDLIVTPHTKRAMLRNIALVEQIFCSPHGSVLSYQNGSVQRERDPRPASQIALCDEIREAALKTAALLHSLDNGDSNSSFLNMDRAAASGASILARLLFLPTDEELSCLAKIDHDVNLGTQTLQPLVATDVVHQTEHTHGLGGAFTRSETPMWLAGSLAQSSSYRGLLYALFASGTLPGGQLADKRGGSLDIALISNQHARPVTVTWMRTATGTMRIRIPIKQSMSIDSIVLPIGELGQQGRVVSTVVQHGTSAKAAMESVAVRKIAASELTWIATAASGAFFSDAIPGTSYLVLAAPDVGSAIAILTIEIDITQRCAITADLQLADRSETVPPERQALVSA